MSKPSRFGWIIGSLGLVAAVAGTFLTFQNFSFDEKGGEPESAAATCLNQIPRTLNLSIRTADASPATNLLVTITNFTRPDPYASCSEAYWQPDGNGGQRAIVQCSLVYGGNIRIWARSLSHSFLPYDLVDYCPSANGGGNYPHLGLVGADPHPPIGITGQVRSPSGIALRNVQVSISAETLETRFSATTSTFGYFSIEGLPAGHRYVITPISKRYRFTPIERLSYDPIENLEFVASE